MRRLLPTSLLGQVTLVLAIGLLLAQAVSAIALYRAQEQRRDASLINSIAFRLIASEGPRELRRARIELREERFRQLRERQGSGPQGRPAGTGTPARGGRSRPVGFARLLRLSLQRSKSSPVRSEEARLAQYETELRRVLTTQEITVGEIRITRRIAGADPHVASIMNGLDRPRFRDWRNLRLIVAAIERSGGGEWLTVRLPESGPQRGRIVPILLQTAVIFIVLFALLFLVLRRITRPLAVLTARLSDFSRQPDRPERLPESGPTDVQRLIAAHNEMETRIAALLDEKNVMLGAIGHDLKTPLAALRVRIESHPDERQRAALADTIEDITRTLDDILSLARIGAQTQSREVVDLSALARSVVEEFEDIGQPARIDPGHEQSARVVACIHETWIKRAVRNLISNAVRYGGGAQVKVERVSSDSSVVIAVMDEGPGIPDECIADMLEPFARGEDSRNRATGGAGLGLTLARAIAHAHAGELIIENRPGGGLSAELHLPA